MKTNRRIDGEAAFSLIELLTVMAIVALLSTFATIGISSVSGASLLGTNLSRMASYIDQSRSYAIANGTYVYVGHRAVANGEPATELVAVASMNGEDLSGTDLTVGSGDVSLLSKPLIANQINLDASAGVAYTPSITRPTGAAPLSNTKTITVKAGDSNAYSIILAFSPSGSVSYGGSILPLVEFGLRQTGDTNKAGVIQVAGLTGMSRVYQQ